MRSAVLNGGGYEVSTPQVGDLIFYHDGSRYCHVAIMINSTESVHGNYHIASSCSVGAATCTTEVTASDTITDVTKWVKYQVK